MQYEQVNQVNNDQVINILIEEQIIRKEKNLESPNYFDECCICLDYLDINLFTLNCCKNIIHNHCMINWLIQSKSDICFLCKQKIPNLNSLLDNKSKLNPIEIVIINNIINPYIAINMLHIPNRNENNPSLENRNDEESSENKIMKFGKFLVVLLSLAILITFVAKIK